MSLIRYGYTKIIAEYYIKFSQLHFGMYHILNVNS